ncbi:Fic family protein [Mumia sp. zg.B53]|uniref:Fic family protein n=1 Tax=unclassified Mumia TaxID=2621872 RepID=UPI001C6E498A|nr:MULTISPECIES: Fic family protein [unclassified Mumia]MBW9208736.1 Fic family protein [Mumia sp. zg.B21]MBW9213347.1 Fic family protein [Mumia sp. zg.B53]
MDKVPWPAVRWEERPWPDRPAGLARHRRRRHPEPYEAAVVPAITAAQVDLDTALIAEAEEAAVEVARFDTWVSRAFSDHPEPEATELTELGPMSTILLRSESASSSQIENLTAGAHQLALAEIGAATGPEARLVARNVATMRAALALADRLDLASVLALHRTLLADSDPSRAGRWRDEQVWVGGTPYSPHAAEFVPPHHSRVPEAMADLIAFVRRDDLPVLVQAALAHAQLETIHPFTDGNGRTGRALVHAVLRSKGISQRVTVPISAGLLTDTSRYFTALGAYRDGDPAPIVAEMAGATMRAIANGNLLVADLIELRDQWSRRVVARRDAAVHRMPPLLVRHPAVDNPLVARELGISDVAAQSAIDRLVDAGILVQVGSGVRHRVWHCPEVVAALDAFATRAGRASRG